MEIRNCREKNKQKTQHSYSPKENISWNFCKCYFGCPNQNFLEIFKQKNWIWSDGNLNFVYECCFFLEKGIFTYGPCQREMGAFEGFLQIREYIVHRPRAGESASAWQRRWEPSKGPESRSRTVNAKLESNSEPERARVCQRVAVRASESQSGSHREP